MPSGGPWHRSILHLERSVGLSNARWTAGETAIRIQNYEAGEYGRKVKAIPANNSDMVSMGGKGCDAALSGSPGIATRLCCGIRCPYFPRAIRLSPSKPALRFAPYRLLRSRRPRSTRGSRMHSKISFRLQPSKYGSHLFLSNYLPTSSVSPG